MHPRPMSNKVKNAMPSLTFVRVAQSMANLCVDDPANGKVGNRGQWAVGVHVIGCSSIAAAFRGCLGLEGCVAMRNQDHPHSFLSYFLFLFLVLVLASVQNEKIVGRQQHECV